MSLKISVLATLQLVAPILAAQTTTIHVRVVDGRTGASLPGMNLSFVDYHNGRSGGDHHEDLDGRKYVTTSAERGLYIASPNVQGGLVFNGMGRDGMWITCSNQKFYDTTSQTYGSDYLYPVSTIMNSGLVTKNGCGNASEAAKAGELVLFIRPTTWWERFLAGMRS